MTESVSRMSRILVESRTPVTGLLSHYKHDDSDVISFLIYASWFSEPLIGKSLRNVCYSAGA